MEKVRSNFDVICWIRKKRISAPFHQESLIIKKSPYISKQRGGKRVDCTFDMSAS
jgi:hypothetical protein